MTNFLPTRARSGDTTSISKETFFTALFLFLINLSPSYGQNGKRFLVQTSDNVLLLGVDGAGRLNQLRYGYKLSPEDEGNHDGSEQAEAYPSFGINVSAAGLRIVHADGNGTTDLVFKNGSETKIDSNIKLTRIVMEDRYYPLEVTLCYRAYYRENIIEQWTEVHHRENKKIALAEVASANLAVNNPAYFLTYFNGDWMNEFNKYETPLQPGTMVLDSREGVRTAQKTSPSFLLSMHKKLEEETGEVIGGTLAWPGNWQIQFNADPAGKLRIIAGINPYASSYALAPGKNFRSPSLLYTFSRSGSGEVTRRFHRWARNYGMHNGNGDRETVLNNWETTGMDFTEEKLSGLIRQGGELGLGLFLLDDGWFATRYPRNTDQAGLGDWEVNTKKLPGGIPALIRESRKNGMDFGIWIEPEMVSPKSRLFETHPDWALSAPHREMDLQRSQLILDLANPKVQDYLVSVLDRLISENPGLNYLKWDCNRFLTNAWSSYLPAGEQSNLYVDYAKGYLSVLERFRKLHPGVTLMLCASGGGRMDYGSLPFFDEYWPSDNSGAHDRVKIQWGMNYFFPSLGFAAHISDMGRTTPLKFRFDVAMAGKLGMDMQLGHLNESDRAFAKKAIVQYGSVKDIVLHGDLFRLLSPYENDRTALMYVSGDQKRAVLFSYLLEKGNGADLTPVHLRGLKPEGRYKLTEINTGSYSRFDRYEGMVFSGKFLMEEGLKFAFWNVHESTVVLLSEQ